MFVSPQNYDNSPTEHGLIEMAKRPADHMQKSGSLFVSQVTKHLLETMLIKKAHQSLLHSCSIQNTEKRAMISPIYQILQLFTSSLMKTECVYLCGWVKSIYKDKFLSIILLWNGCNNLREKRAHSPTMLMNYAHTLNMYRMV